MKRQCPNCGKTMEFEPCEALECDNGYDADDCLGFRPCPHCWGDGGKWFCEDCAHDYEDED